MTSYPSFPDGALFQILIAIGRMEQRQADQARALDTLIRILQEQNPPSSQKQAEQPPSRRSMLATTLERLSSKVLMDVALFVLKKAARLILPYLIPWSIFIGGLTWLGKGLLKLLGLS